jgi:PncC family amidohydrolase
LKKRNETIAVAESVTSGLLQIFLASATQAESFYQGGLTAYNMGQKFKHLAVEPIHARSVNCVSAKVAEQMATNICKLFSSDWGIAVTGYATAVPESDNKLFAYYCIVYHDKAKNKGRIIPKDNDPSLIQQQYATTILKKLLELM